MACGREGLSDNYITIMEQRIQYTVYRVDTQHGNMNANAGHLSTDTWAAGSKDGEYGVRVLLDTVRRRKHETIIHISTSNIDIKYEKPLQCQHSLESKDTC